MSQGLLLCVGGFWRAWFGGSFWNISRIWQILVLFVVCYAAYVQTDFLSFCKWGMPEYCCAVWSWGWFMRFWNHSHGDYFVVLDTGKDEGRSKWVDACLRVLYGKEGYYNFKGNVTGLLIGYTVPAILSSIVMPSPLFCFAGAVVALIYGVCGLLFADKRYTKIAECVSGAVCFYLYYLSLRGE